MNFTRRLILNLVFFGLLFLLLAVMAAVMASGGGKPLQERTTLVIAPEGRLVEQFSADPLSRALAKAVGDKGAEVQLRDLLRAIERPATTRRSSAWCWTGQAAGQRFRLDARSGRRAAGCARPASRWWPRREHGPVASTCWPRRPTRSTSTRWVPAARRPGPLPPVLPPPACRTSSAWTCTCSRWASTSPPPSRTCSTRPRRPAKEADLFWMNDVWQRYLSDIAAARKLDAEQLAAGIDALPEGIAAAGGDLAKFALQQKLVDGLKTARTWTTC
jgi:protease-4